jgi:hypothetical protein
VPLSIDVEEKATMTTVIGVAAVGAILAVGWLLKLVEKLLIALAKLVRASKR